MDENISNIFLAWYDYS